MSDLHQLSTIPLTSTEQIALLALQGERQRLEIKQRAVESDIATRVGIQVSDIGTKYALFLDALVLQP